MLCLQIRDSESKYYAFLAGHIDEVRRMQHDILHHLRVMSGYARPGTMTV